MYVCVYGWGIFIWITVYQCILAAVCSVRGGGRYNYYDNSEWLMSINNSTADKITGPANILLWLVAYILMEGNLFQLKVSENKEKTFPCTIIDPLNSVHGPIKGLWV